MLQLCNICKSYKTESFTQTALDNVSIGFRQNEFVAILGPSGSGKTTMLNIIGGLDHYDSGDLIIEGISTKEYKDQDWDAYRNNRIGFVFQSYNLIPHQTILSNVELALTLSGVSKEERQQRAKDALIEVGLGDHIDKKPSQLSGGQMQRVAIARALINDPEILLADEPTGALDSKTSTQIMDLLTKIASDRLVIMVTHNPELADQYANRIVSLADGVITSDTNPYNPTAEELTDAAERAKSSHHTKMSFRTALGLSFNNLMTKKGRTIMTAFAGSIGIIGIAAILSLANGINDYIDTVEEETMSEYPLTITTAGFDMTSMLVGSTSDDSAEKDAAKEAAKEAEEEKTDTAATDTATEKKDGEKTGSASENLAEEAGKELKILPVISGTFSSIGNNDLASLKKYLDSDECNIDEYTNAVEYKYDIAPQIFSSSTKNGVHQVNPDKSFSSMGFGSGSSNSLMSMSMSTDVFYEMPANENLYKGQYDVVAGHWPENYNEVILVATEHGYMTDFMLYTLGLRDPKELDKMVKQFMNEEDVKTPDVSNLTYSYDDIMKITFKLVNASDYYQYDSSFGVWKDKSDDKSYMKDLVKKGEDIKIVGVVKQKEDTKMAMLQPGINYMPALTQHVISQAAESKIVKQQLKDPKVNVFSGKKFTEEEDGAGAGFDMGSLFSIDEGALSAAFSFNPEALTIDPSTMDIDPSSIDMSNLDLDLSDAPAFSMGEGTGEGEGGIDTDAIASGLAQIMQGYMMVYQGAIAQGQTPPTPDEFMHTEAVQSALAEALGGAVDPSAMEEEVGAAMNDYMTNTFQPYLTQKMTESMTGVMAQLSETMGAAVESTMAGMSESLANAFSIDEAAFASAFQVNMDADDLTEVMMSMMSGEENSYDNNLKKLGYAKLSSPSVINIYPKNFETKENVIDILDGYNDRMEAEDETKVVNYTDIVGVLMSSVTRIVNAISAVLIAFVSISLVVSSIMIGVITYISVLERRKEIGILRSIGARKRDISRVFNAETVIVGFIAGLIGVVITAILTIPASAIVYAKYAVPHVAQLPVGAAIILVLISVFLTFIAGLIPSGSASRKDPVEALRSE